MALTSRLPSDFCPSCGQELDAATNLDYHTPKAGDVSVCLHCQTVLQWDKNMKLRLCDMVLLPPQIFAQVLNVIIAMKTVLPRLRHERN